MQAKKHRSETVRHRRKFKTTKPYIVVFCEGESEKAYISCIQKFFCDVAVIKKQKMSSFKDALSILTKNPSYRDALEITDEIWFFFDAENDKADTWPEVEKIIRRIEHLKSGHKIKVRLLMTTGCVEYWFLLHFEQCAPSISTRETKENVEAMLRIHEPTYQKGEEKVTSHIAENFETAIVNGSWSIQRLQSVGIPSIIDCPERNAWLFQGLKTFSTVQEALIYLQELVCKGL